MGYFCYVEIFRQTSQPNDETVFNDLDFFVLGDFDGMFVQPQQQSIAALKQYYEKRHEGPVMDGNPSTHSSFLTTDRQPIFLFSPEEIPSGSKGIFSTENSNTHPIVLSLFQLDKEHIKQPSLDNFVSGCRESINGYMQYLPYCKGCKTPKKRRLNCRSLQFDVFLNLGEADLAVVFRSQYLQCIARLLENIRGAAVLAGAPILSISSYYGFPRTDSWSKSIKTWLRGESATSGANFHLNLLYDIPAGEVVQRDLPAKRKLVRRVSRKENISFVFGEWDYLEYWNAPRNVNDAVEMLTKDIELHWGKNVGEDCNNPLSEWPVWRRSSFVIASFKWPQLQNPKTLKANISPDRTDIPSIQVKIAELNEALSAEFSDLIDVINELVDLFGNKYVNETKLILSSLNRTICGLLGFLTRLYIGRYEQDLYQYIAPVFKRLVKIIKSYSGLIYEYAQGSDETVRRKAAYYIDECVSDTGELITRLQQIYTVMGVSPHTFMETYGSSMRSLAASSKLMCAYQGMLHYIEKQFRRINGDSNENHTFLITPYRLTQPTNQLLYALSSPSDRIVNIQVDYTKLFSRNAVFMLLHECAHRSTDRLREDRYHYFAKAWFSMIFHETFGYWITDPIGSFYRQVTLESAPVEGYGDRFIFYGLPNPEDCTRRFGENISVAVARYSDKASDKIAQVMTSVYRVSVHSQDKFHMRDTNKSVRENTKNYLLKNKLINEYSEHIQKAISKIATDIKNYIAANKGNTREAIRLELLYNQPDSNEQLLKDFPGTLNKMLADTQKIELLPALFSDVYADLLAIIVLGENMGADGYIGAFLEFFGSRAQELLTDNDYYLLRVMTVSEAMGWPINSGTRQKRDIFIEKLIIQQNIPADFAMRLRSDWYRLERMPYRQPVLDYARKCKQSIEERVSLSLCDVEFGAIRCLWQNMDDGTDETIMSTTQSIYSLWLYLMRSYKDEEVANAP